MNEKEIIQHALDRLQGTEEIKATWIENTPNETLDGQLALHINGQKIKFDVEIKKELRKIHLPKLEALDRDYDQFMIVAPRIFPNIKKELRNRNIAYLEANGNIYFKENGIYLWLDVNAPIKVKNTNTNRAFTKTGLKVVYQFLLDEQLINNTYREIAERTDTGIGNITNIFNGLKDDGFLIPLTKNTHILDRKKELLDKWILAYEKLLKPQLFIGAYRFVDDNKFYNWADIALKEGATFWGGEPAGDIYTNYLRPEELTLYTTETRNEIMKNYRLVPDENGNVKIYEKFWYHDNEKNNVVDPLLAYIDLIMKGDRRCNETAHKIYDEQLQDRF